MSQKGFTLLEIIGVMLLVAVLTMETAIGYNLVEKVRFESKVTEVVQHIEYIKVTAAATGKLYVLFSYGDSVRLLHQGRSFKKVYLGKGLKIPPNITGQELRFNGKIVPHRGGTILIVHQGLKMQARVTVVPVTGKVRVYYEKI